MTVELSDTEFDEKYKPIAGPDGSDLRQWHELAEFYKTDAGLHHVWSCTEGDDGGLYLGPGFHVVNMIGYVVTERPWMDDDIVVNWYTSDDEDRDEEDE